MRELIRRQEAEARDQLETYVPTRWESSVVFAGAYLQVTGHLARAAPLLPDAHNGVSALSRDQGLVCARECAIQMLARAADALGTVDRVVRVLKLKLILPEGLHGSDRAAVGEAGSGVFVDVLGEARGRHRRVVVPVPTLPEGILIEAQVSMRVGEWGRVSGGILT